MFFFFFSSYFWVCFQVVDLKNKVSISVYTVPGEQDLGEDGYQVQYQCIYTTWRTESRRVWIPGTVSVYIQYLENRI